MSSRSNLCIATGVRGRVDNDPKKCGSGPRAQEPINVLHCKGTLPLNPVGFPLPWTLFLPILLLYTSSTSKSVGSTW